MLKAVLTGGEKLPTEYYFLRYKYRKVKEQLLLLVLTPGVALTVAFCVYLTLICLFFISRPSVSPLSHPVTASSLSPISLTFLPNPDLVNHC